MHVLDTPSMAIPMTCYGTWEHPEPDDATWHCHGIAARRALGHCYVLPWPDCGAFTGQRTMAYLLGSIGVP